MNVELVKLKTIAVRDLRPKAALDRERRAHETENERSARLEAKAALDRERRASKSKDGHRARLTTKVALECERAWLIAQVMACLKANKSVNIWMELQRWTAEEEEGKMWLEE